MTSTLLITTLLDLYIAEKLSLPTPDSSEQHQPNALRGELRRLRGVSLAYCALLLHNN